MTILKEELVRQREVLELYLETTSSVGIALLDPALKILDCNHGFTKMFHTRNKPIGSPVDDFLKLGVNDLKQPGEFKVSCNNRSGAGGILYCQATVTESGLLLFCERLMMSESRAMEQIGVINNELITLQREAVKKNLLLEKLRRELAELNQSLEERLNSSLNLLRRKDDTLIQQGRLAAMGEMINNIAHQWRQPLNSLGLILQALQLNYEDGDLTAEQMSTEIDIAMDVIMYMSGTIDDFRNFFSTDKELSVFSVNQVVSSAVNFVLPALKINGINVELVEQPDISAKGYPNEYLQALLNIFNNAKDILLELKVAEPLISIRICRENDRSVVTIRDNGGGINEDVLPKIFDPYFTTKERDKGTGIGLYMSKAIIDKNMNGRLSVCNVAGGAEFRIEV